MKSGFYVSEQGDYVYVFGGKIIIKGGIISENEVGITIGESDSSFKTSEIGNDTDAEFNKDRPRTHLVFDNLKSIQCVIDVLEGLKNKLK